MFDDHNDDNDDFDPFLLMIKVVEEDEGSKERGRLKLDEWWRERNGDNSDNMVEW